MGKGERFRRWLAGLVWPEVAEQEREITELVARLGATHKRMQGLYWEGKAKEAALARIAGLTDGLQRALVALYCSGEPQAAQDFEDELRVGWSTDMAERFLLPEIIEEEVDPI